MRLTRLEIENFKGIGERQVIEIRPITLLFGPNSAGKTTILQALEYLRQCLSGEIAESNLGNFRSLVHCHDPSKTIRIKGSIEFDDTSFSENGEYFPQRQPLGAEVIDSPINYWNSDRNNSFNKVTSVAITMEVRENQRDLEIEINLHKILKIDRFCCSSSDFGTENSTIRIPPGGFDPSPKYEAKQHTLEINLRHYLLEDFNGKNVVEYGLENQSKDNVYKLQKDDDVQLGKIREESKKGRIELETDSHESKKETVSFLEKEVLDLVFELNADSELYNTNDTISLGIIKLDLDRVCDYNVSPLDIPMPIDIVPEKIRSRVEKYSSDRSSRWFYLEQLFSELLFGSVRCVLASITFNQEMAPFHEVRSLRPIPERGKTQTILDEIDNDDDFLREVNFWLTDKNRFNLDYLIRSEDSPAHMKLYDKKRKIFLDIADVGVGISQLIPVVVEALIRRKGYRMQFDKASNNLVAMEQPELHLHPAMQVVLGDLFITSSNNSGTTFLIETHSEHLLLRLLRRIREHTDNSLPADTLGLELENLSVIYVEPVRTKNRIRTRIIRLRVDKTGEFSDRWPKGFFEERYEELF